MQLVPLRRHHILEMWIVGQDWLSWSCVLAGYDELVASLGSFEEIKKTQFLKLLHYWGVKCRYFCLILLQILGSELFGYQRVLNCHSRSKRPVFLCIRQKSFNLLLGIVISKKITAGVLVRESHRLTPLQQFELPHHISHCPVLPPIANQLKIDR